ncbi:MAG: hypothetical protein JWM27_4748 [Gemmatimonadetes bacterium]|nr:hypothetical protein [Gemmatimonadota bacterium]
MNRHDPHRKQRMDENEMTSEEAAAELGITVHSFHNLRSCGRAIRPVRRRGRRVLFDRADVLDLKRRREMIPVTR